jgi:PPK2 family polyphosphate:nucleotide phosphotransferase
MGGRVYGKTVKPGSKVSIKQLRTELPDAIEKDVGEAVFGDYAKEIGELQELLFAAGTHALLVIFQGMDTSGKDGATKDVFREVNPCGCRVVPFGVPTEEELAHDFLWRIHQKVPARGQIVVFNRSQYEDVLVVRVHDLAPDEVLAKRYEQINAFEKLLTDTNTIVLKFFLHISKDEQEVRLLEREQNPIKSWKLSVGDWKERTHWAKYQEAYEDALQKCSTDYAPWHVIPADRKWFRNLAVSEIVVTELRKFRDEWTSKLRSLSETQEAALAEARAEGAIPQPSPKAVAAADD